MLAQEMVPHNRTHTNVSHAMVQSRTATSRLSVPNQRGTRT